MPLISQVAVTRGASSASATAAAPATGSGGCCGGKLRLRLRPQRDTPDLPNWRPSLR